MEDDGFDPAVVTGGGCYIGGHVGLGAKRSMVRREAGVVPKLDLQVGQKNQPLLSFVPARRFVQNWLSEHNLRIFESVPRRSEDSGQRI